MRCFTANTLTAGSCGRAVHDQGWGSQQRLALPARRIATAADFIRELQALRERSGLTIREVAQAAKTPVATTGDCFSGRHLPLDREQFARILGGVRRDRPGAGRGVAGGARPAAAAAGPARTGTPYRGLARFEAEPTSGCSSAGRTSPS